MEWFYRKRRSPEWKQGWSGQTLASISTQPPPLLAIFGIVLILLWLSPYTGYKAQLHLTAINFQLFIYLSPILLILLMASISSTGDYSFRLPRLVQHRSMHQAGGMPWGLAVLVVVLLVLLFYQSSFNSGWFGASYKY